MAGLGVATGAIQFGADLLSIFLTKKNKDLLQSFVDVALKMNREELSGLSLFEVTQALKEDTKYHQARDLHITGNCIGVWIW